MQRPLFIISLEGVHGTGKSTINTHLEKMLKEKCPHLAEQCGFITDTYIELLPDLEKTLPFMGNFIREFTFFNNFFLQIVDLYASGKSIIFTDRCMTTAPLYERALATYDPDNAEFHQEAIHTLMKLMCNMTMVLFKNIPTSWHILNISRPFEVIEKTLKKRNENNPHPVQYKEGEHKWNKLVHNLYDTLNLMILSNEGMNGLTFNPGSLRTRIKSLRKECIEHVIHFDENPLEEKHGATQIDIVISIMCSLLKRTMVTQQEAHLKSIQRFESEELFADSLLLYKEVHEFHKIFQQNKDIHDYMMGILKKKLPEEKLVALGLAIYPSVFYSYDGPID